MNQEKIMKAKMITAMVICIAALAGLFVFIGLYMDKSEEVRKTYIAKYMENLSAASEEINTYLENGKDLPTRYNMILSDMGAARSLVFLINDYTEEQKAINELHYCFVKYPEQMQGKLEDVKKALDHITENLDKGYKEVNEIVDSVDKMGNYCKEDNNVSSKGQLKREIKKCRLTIEEIERKRSRSQSALVQAILLQEEPNEMDVEWFNKYTGEITACRNHMIELQKELDSMK